MNDSFFYSIQRIPNNKLFHEFNPFFQGMKKRYSSTAFSINMSEHAVSQEIIETNIGDFSAASHAPSPIIVNPDN